MPTLKSKPITHVINVSRHCWSRMSGENGTPSYDDHLYGFPLEKIVGPLGDGAQVEITVRVLNRGRKVRNPWLRKRGR